MVHKKYEKIIVLDFYKEASPEEKAKLEKHLSSCWKCREFKKNLGNVIPEKEKVDDSRLDRTLAEARSEFRQTLFPKGQARDKPVPVYKFRQRPRIFEPVPVYAITLVAIVMIAIGGVSTFLFLHRTSNGAASVISELTPNNRNDVAIDNINFISTDPKSGEVQFSFDLVRRCEMKGSLDNQDVQKILAYALVNSANPGVRLKTVSMLNKAADARPDNEIENALVKAVKSDDNAGVRRESLLSLKKLPFDNKIKDAILFVLQRDKNPGLRVMAIDYLSGQETAMVQQHSASIDPKVLEVLKQESSSDQNHYVRLKAAGMLKEITEL